LVIHTDFNMEYSIKTEPDFDIKWIKSEAELKNMDCDVKIEIEVDDVGNNNGNNNSPFFKQDADQTDHISSDLESQGRIGSDAQTQSDQMPVGSDFLAYLSKPIPSTNPQVIEGRIGSGSKKVEFFYENRESPAFPPVYVDTEEQVRAVAAFAAEKEAEFNLRCDKEKHAVIQYYTEAAIAKSTLEKDVLKHIQSCFTKKGMRDYKRGVKRRNYPKRSTIIKINQGQKQAKDETKINTDPSDAECPSKDEKKVGFRFCASPFKTIKMK